MNKKYLGRRILIILVMLFIMNNLNAQQIIEGIHYATGKPIQVSIENGKISKIKSIDKLSENKKNFIAPGFFDNQVNGFAGVSFAFGEI